MFRFDPSPFLLTVLSYCTVKFTVVEWLILLEEAVTIMVLVPFGVPTAPLEPPHPLSESMHNAARMRLGVPK